MKIPTPDVTTGQAGTRTYLLVQRYDRTDVGGRWRRLFAIHDRIRLRYHTLKLRALIWVLRRQRAVDYRSIYRENEKQMETIPKKRLRRIGIRNDISLTIKPSSIIIPIAPTVLLRRPPRL